MNGAEQEAGRSQGQCSKCSQSLTPETSVHLWDGKDYCRDCVEAACPGMADYTAAHATLEETTPRRIVARLQRRAANRVLLLAFPTVAALLLWRWASGPDPLEMILFAGLLWVLALAFFGLFLLLQTRPSVAARAGRVTAWQFRPLFRQSSGPLHKYRWRTTTRAEIPGLRMGMGEDVVVIGLLEKHLWRGVVGRETPCGWTPEMRGIWVGFLTLAGVPQKPMKRK